jgi:hypothetical protein
MYSLARFVTLALALTLTAAAQDSIEWRPDPRAAIIEAKQTERPVLFYIVDTSEEAKAFSEAQDRAFDDPRVSTIISSRYVPARFHDSPDTQELLRELDIADTVPLSIIVLTPDGHVVQTILPHDVARAETLASHLEEAFNKYREILYEQKLKPRLTDPSTSPVQLDIALRLVESFAIREADHETAGLLKRPDLSEALRKQVFASLAALSTEEATMALLDAAAKDSSAVEALKQCTPAAVESLLPELRTDNHDRFLIAYEALTSICEVPDPQPESFWDDASLQTQHREIDRVKRAAADCLKQWRQDEEPYR